MHAQFEALPFAEHLLAFAEQPPNLVLYFADLELVGLVAVLQLHDLLLAQPLDLLVPLLVLLAQLVLLVLLLNQQPQVCTFAFFQKIELSATTPQMIIDIFDCF